FFQAEDGIRDFHVTGVQTCALPILSYFVYSFGLQWGDDTAGFFTGTYLRLADVGGADPWFTLDFVPAVLIPLVLVWVAVIVVLRSEERRVGKGCRPRWPRPGTRLHG